MPIMTEGDGSSESVAGGRIVRLPGLPDFNADDPSFKINTFEGWFDGVRPVPTLVANGGGPGAVAVGGWDPAERFYTIAGRIDAASSSRASLRQLLLAAFPHDRETSIGVLGGNVDEDLQAFVRLYDAPTFPPGESVLRFTFPLVAVDPYKYGLTALSATAGAFVPADWFRTYDVTGDAYRTYAPDGGLHYREYTEDEESTSTLPKSAAFDSVGSVASPRMTITVTGPLTAGDWFIRDDVTGEQLWAEISLNPGQSLVFDSRQRLATISGSPVDHLVFGDYLTLSPGSNSFRLVTGTPSDGFMQIEALEAHE